MREETIAVRFERLLERILRLRRKMEELRAKNLRALGRKEEL